MKNTLMHPSRYAYLILAVMPLLFSQCNSSPKTSNTSEPIDYNKMLSDQVVAINKTCPRMVDNETKWDNTSFNPSSFTFQYNYTLINKNKSEVDTAALITYLFPILINNARTNPDFKTFLASRVKLSYSYSDKNGEYLFRVLITPEQYED
jgi:hypothetical protein